MLLVTPHTLTSQHDPSQTFSPCADHADASGGQVNSGTTGCCVDPNP